MATVREIHALLDARIPRALSCDWDNDGLMVAPDPNREVHTVLLALDITERAVAFAEQIGAELILSHHPLIFHKIARLDGEEQTARKAMRLLASGIAAMSFHTRFDTVSGGINDLLAEALSLSDVEPFGPDGEKMGRIGTLARPMTLPDFCRLVKETLGAPAVFASDAHRAVSRVALLGGAGGDFIGDALQSGADTFLTGEAGYNAMLDAAQNRLSVVAAGHYHTEALFARFFKAFLGEAFPDLSFVDFPTGCEIVCY